MSFVYVDFGGILKENPGWLGYIIPRRVGNYHAHLKSLYYKIIILIRLSFSGTRDSSCTSFKHSTSSIVSTLDELTPRVKM